MSTLRSKLIKLAFEEPSIRQPLLRILTGSDQAPLKYDNRRLGEHIRLSWNTNSVKIEELPQQHPLKRRVRVFRLFTDWEVKQGFDGYRANHLLANAGVDMGDTYDEAISKIKRNLQDLAVEYQRNDGPIKQHFLESNLHYLNVPPKNLNTIEAQGHNFTITVVPHDYMAISPVSEVSDREGFQARMIPNTVASSYRLYKILSANPTTIHSVYWKDLPDWLTARGVGFDYLYEAPSNVTLFNDKKASVRSALLNLLK